jgi:DNA-directed RNA polymerase specialized sigma24 family protein
LSNGEIADFLGKSKNAVAFRISRGKALLIEMLGKEGDYVREQQKRSR